jgi:hypothetical protein
MDYNAPYVYRPLSSGDTFRLLHLEPSVDPDSQVKGSLEHTALTQYKYELIDHYTALSYVWGEQKDIRTIIIDGHLLEVTENLELVLRCLRDRRQRVLRVWADAICINQNDATEKNAQVRKMGDIYRHAHHTLIYLAESSTDLDLFISNSELHLKEHLPPKEKTQPRKRLKSSSIDIEMLDNAIRQSLKSLLSQPWFTRVWILQEIVLSRDPWIQCGMTRVSWNQFCDFYSFTVGKRNSHLISKEQSNLVCDTSIFDNIRTARDYHQYWGGRNPNENTLLNLVKSRRAFGVSDPRDMIYAHMSLASDVTSVEIEIGIDYGKTVCEVYEDAAIYWTKRREDVLRLAETTEPSQKHLGLASWVPDWTCMASVPFPDVSLPYPFRYDHPTRIVKELAETSQLLCQGVLLGPIIQVGKIFPIWNCNEPEKTCFEDYLLRYRESNKAHSDQLGKSSILNLGRQTLDMACKHLATDWIEAIGLGAFKNVLDDDLEYSLSRFVRNILYTIPSSTPTEVTLPEWEMFIRHPLHCTSLIYLLRNKLEKEVLYDQTSLDLQWLKGRRFACGRFREYAKHFSSDNPILSPKSTQPGDVIAFLPIGDFRRVFALRPLTEKADEMPVGHYRLIGECFSGRLPGFDPGLKDTFIIH